LLTIGLFFKQIFKQMDADIFWLGSYNCMVLEGTGMRRANDTFLDFGDSLLFMFRSDQLLLRIVYSLSHAIIVMQMNYDCILPAY